MNTGTLREKWEALKVEQPHLRIRNAAEMLNVSEAELLATKIGETVIRLKPNFVEILSEVESLGKVMGLTRNEECVHERKGVYANADFSNPHAGLFVNPDIDQRIFLSHWAKAYAVSETSAHGDRTSLQFFGSDGYAIHKIFLTKDSNVDAYKVLVEKYKDDNQSTDEVVTTFITNDVEKPDSEIDVQGFQKEWLELKDTHDFFMLLKKFGVTRTQALRLAPSDYYAKQVDKDAIVTALEGAAKSKLPIMIFVGNRGNIQIHTGEIRRTMWQGSWFNIMDPDFNLHLDMSKVASAWIVRKPAEGDIVTSIEVFNEKGDTITQIFGKRKPGIPELEGWRELVNSL